MQEHWGVHHVPTEELIKHLSVAQSIQLTRHAAQRILQRRIRLRNLYEALSNDVHILKHYPRDVRGHCCMIQCRCPNGNTYQCVCAVIEDDQCAKLRLLIISVWVP